MGNQMNERKVGSTTYRGHKIIIWECLNPYTNKWETEYGNAQEPIFKTLDDAQKSIDRDIGTR